MDGAVGGNGAATAEADVEDDPLDAFMTGLGAPTVTQARRGEYITATAVVLTRPTSGDLGYL